MLTFFVCDRCKSAKTSIINDSFGFRSDLLVSGKVLCCVCVCYSVHDVFGVNVFVAEGTKLF